VLWDGGNNDYPFVRPDLSIVVLDALRPGHEIGYYPGETNLRAANVLVLNKVSSASTEALELTRRNVAELNPNAALTKADLVATLEPGVAIAGKRVVVVEDGPTLTHGGMAYGAGTVAAPTAGALILDPRDFAIGSIAAVYRDSAGQRPHRCVRPRIAQNPSGNGRLSAHRPFPCPGQRSRRISGRACPPLRSPAGRGHSNPRSQESRGAARMPCGRRARRRLRHLILSKYRLLDRFYLETHFSRGHVSEILRGKDSQSISALIKPVAALNVEVCDLFIFPSERLGDRGAPYCSCRND
jgi:hypothetical protein